MAITAEFQTGIAHVVGCERMAVEIDGPATVEIVLRALAAADPKIAAALIEDDGTLDLSLLIAINDRVIPRSSWSAHGIRDGATVEVHVAFVGG
jgi:sulfur carrier protein ThiS